MKNGSLLDTFAEAIRHLGFHTYRAAEWYRGELFVHELLPASACLNSYSIAKVFTVTAAGLLYDRGLMSVEEKVAEIFRREFPEAHDPKWERMTVDHVLSHRAGFPSGFLDIDVQDRSEYGTDDFLQYLFRTRLACEPGEQWIYSDAAFYLLSRIITKKTGRLLDELLWREVFSPLGFQEAAWSKCPMGYPMGATGLYIRTQDMVKLGALYLRQGTYAGKRILSEHWTRLVLERGYELCPAGKNGAYGKGGMYGQMLVVFPEDERVLAWHSHDGRDPAPLLDWLSRRMQ